MIQRNSKKYLALTLMELVVAVSLFAIMALAVTRVFLRVMDVQAKIGDQQNLEGDLRYAIGVLADEAQKSKQLTAGQCSECAGTGSCNAGSFFCLKSSPNTQDKLCLVDANNTCVQYFTQNGRLVVQRGATQYTITSQDIYISKLFFDYLYASSSVAIRLTATSSKNAAESLYYQTAITNSDL